MAKISKATTADALHTELCAAIADLAKSVDIAVSQMALRAKFTAVIADATKTERAAEAFRVAVTHSTETEEKLVILMAGTPKTAKSRRRRVPPPDARTGNAVGELYEACSWLATMQAPRLAPEAQKYRNESVIAMRILELQDRLGGLAKKPR